MPTDFDDKEPSLKMEAVERRGEPRGLVRGVRIELADGTQCAALEASRKGFFVEIGEPDTYALGAAMDIKVMSGKHVIGCRTEVVRKEIHPRRGIALRIAHIAPVAEDTLKRMLEG